MRFSFKENWTSFARNGINDETLARARVDFTRLFRGEALFGKRFLDIGFGQGLSSFLAAEQGASVVAVDIDPVDSESLAGLSRLFPGVATPEFEQGSILDPVCVRHLAERGPYQVVHSWGVLHHTGDLWLAMRNAASLVGPGGLLVIAIYRKHWTSRFWWLIKWLYNQAPALVKALMERVYLSALFFKHRRDPLFLKEPGRGMSHVHDARDWLGGLPYEFASIDEIKRCCSQLGFSLLREPSINGSIGCVEYSFKRN